jgi:hypothetical protein
MIPRLENNMDESVGYDFPLGDNIFCTIKFSKKPTPKEILILHNYINLYLWVLRTHNPGLEEKT